jgi:hypothetical protein
MSDEEEEIARAFLGNEQLKKTEAYVKRGRRFEKIGTPELKERWIAAMKRWAEATSKRTLEDADERTERDDIDAELLLRREEPPLDRVEKEWAVIQAAANAVVEKNDPEVEQGLRDDMETFLDSLKKPSN